MKFNIKKIPDKDIVSFFRKKKIANHILNNLKPYIGTNNENTKVLLDANLSDLYFIYKLVTLSKRVTSLEFGCGFSSEIIASALLENKQKYHKKIKNLRRIFPFQNHVLDASKKYIKITKKRSSYLKNLIFYYSECEIAKYNGKYTVQYKNLPLLSPDFIYLDGPSLYQVKKNKLFNFNIHQQDLFPISSDILLIEYYLIPGTIILIDGRGANAQFLRDHFVRKWSYKYYSNFDMHLFCLNADALGAISKRQLNFFNNHN